MAVENYFTNNAANVGEKTSAGSNAQEIVRIVGTAAVVAADDNNSTYLLAAAVPSSFVPVKATIMCDGITGGTDFDVGVSDPATGDAVDKDLFVDGQTLATASRTLDGLSAVDIADIGANKSIADLLALTPSTALPAYDLVLTGNVVGTAAGDVVYILEGFAA